MMRQAFQRIQGATDVDVLCKAGVRSTVSFFTSNEATPLSAPHGVLMDDTSTKAFSSPSTTLNNSFVGVTGPSPIGDAFGFQSQAFLMTLGNLACTRSLEDPSKWLVLQQGTPERLLLQAGEQQFYRHDRLDANTMHQAFSIHQTVEYYVNVNSSIYHKDRTVKTLGVILDFLQGKVRGCLESLPDSVALVRCDIPFYNPLDPESKEIVEQVVVEYFRPPCTTQWNRRVRRAQVEKPHPWYLSLANGTESSDECFFDGYISNHETQSNQDNTTPLAAALTPIAAVSSPCSGAPMDIGTQAFVTPDRSGYIAPVQPISSILPSVSVSPALSQLSDTTLESMDSSGASLETIDLGGIDKDEYAVPVANQNPGVNNSPDDNHGTSDQSLSNAEFNIDVEPAKPFACPHSTCSLSFTRKGNLATHMIKHTGTTFPCTYLPCTHTSTQNTDRIRHERVVHEGLRWRCEYCSRMFTRGSAAGKHSCRRANGRSQAIRSVTIPVPVMTSTTVIVNDANSASNDNGNSNSHS
jgi:hypothetical protein